MILAFKIDASNIYIDVTDNGAVDDVLALRLDSKNNGLNISLYPRNLVLGAVNLTLAGAGLSQFYMRLLSPR